MTPPLTSLQHLDLLLDALFTHDPGGRIRAVNEPGGEPPPRFVLGRTVDGNRVQYRHDIPVDLVRRLEELVTCEPVNADLRAAPHHMAAYNELLGIAPDAPPRYAGPTFRFPTVLPEPQHVTHITPSNLHLLQRIYPARDPHAELALSREPVVGVVVDGFCVSLCYSSRLTARAAAAGVETLEGYRGRGFAGVAVAAWARTVRAGGRVPLYDTWWGNQASQGVARKLGLVQYGSIVQI